MNPSYSHFNTKYFDKLLEGQAHILTCLEEFFQEIEADKPNYFPTLARMPTGTGKTGVIAVATYFGNHQGSTLILTPWRTLCEQMIKDLKIDFWEHLKLSPDDRKRFLFDPYRMYPSMLGKFLRKNEGRKVLVGTLNGLQTLERKYPRIYKKLSESISLVVVDEGHYEPAVLWGRAVRNLERPTLIVTATPYRNDLKLFLVPKKHVFHYEHYRALKTKQFPLRAVRSIRLAARSSQFEKLLNEFIAVWKKQRPELPDPTPRAIICCETKKRVMQALEIVTDAGIKARAFHERVENEDFNHRPGLKALFQKSVPPAKGSPEEIWIHQNKLTEGVDDPRFTAILLTYPMTNDRKLVQQVGRVLRHSKEAKKKGKQTALIVHCANYEFDTVWENYTEYEKLVDLTTGEHYRRVVLGYLHLQPKYEYFGKRFRKRLEPFAMLPSETTNGKGIPPTEVIEALGDKGEVSPVVEKQRLEEIRKRWQQEAWNAIWTPPSVLILKIGNDFDMKAFVKDTTVGLTLNDAVILNAGDEEGPIINEPRGPVLWLYALIKNSDILLESSAYEISIEARVVQRIRQYLFISDTSGVAVEDYLGKAGYACGYFKLANCMDEDFVVRQASLFSTQSLNTAVRRTIRQGLNLDIAPYQISEKKYLCQNLRAKKKGAVGERYFGLTTGRISDRLGTEKQRRFNLKEFSKWVKDLARTLDSKPPELHSFFGRYASLADPPPEADPYALILDPVPDPAVFQEEHEDLTIRWQTINPKQPVELEETVFDIDRNDDEDEADEWPFLIRLELAASFLRTPAITEVLLRYADGRFQFKKGKTTEFEALYKNDVFTVAHLFSTRPDRYAITLRKPSLVYHNRQFFKLDYASAEAKLATYFKAVSALKDVDFEKIPSDMGKPEKKRLTDWPIRSVFAQTLPIIEAEFGEPVEWLFCDDPQRELADFIAVNFSKQKVSFIHCKYGRGKILSASVFHDLCSQAAKNLVYLRTARQPPMVHTWTKSAKWEGTQIKKWIKSNGVSKQGHALWEHLKSEILEHPKGRVEVWLVMGNGLEVKELQTLAGSSDETAEVGPLLHLLDGLVANCAEAAVTLRIFGQ